MGARFLDLGIVGGALGPPVGRIVLVVAVAIVLAVRFVVFLDVARDIGERVAVVGGNVIHRSPGPPRTPIEQVARAGKPGGEFAAQAGIAAPEAADAVAEAIVPLGESGRMMAELIAAGADVPRLGDQLHARESRDPGGARRRSRHSGRNRRSRGRASRRDRSEIRRRGMRHPVAQRIHHHLQHARIGQVQSVAGAGFVDAVTRIVRDKAVVA